MYFFEEDMIEGYKSVKEKAHEWGVSPRRVQIMCAEGKISGAGKLGREWAIPNDAIRPSDGRETTGAYKNWRNKTAKRSSKE